MPIPANSPYIYPLANFNQFVPVSPKLFGALPGYLGKFKDQPQEYLLKIEHDKRSGPNPISADEKAALESASSQLIRAIFGHLYAADIRLIEVAGSKNQPKWIGNGANIKIKVQCQYAILSAWENCGRELLSYQPLIEPHIQSAFSQNITRLQTIASLVNMLDYKPMNMVMRAEDQGSLFLVDCAADFAGFDNSLKLLDPAFNRNLGIHFIPRIALQTIEKFVTFKNRDFLTILENYAAIIHETNAAVLFDNFVKTKKACKFLLKQQNASLNLTGLFAAERASVTTVTLVAQERNSLG